ncbi:hypothetical protein KP509_39G060100 [Ceratopteris richardii]|uniref:Protein kinase domain-containing protein n=1 Tax=Ceratopteris richardii TaxID=49495 RepID=A0A8T2Q1J3_CERRI|nr:hypothetical protein KP509_39G060100 [Ceratopteris richardii]
MFSYVQEDEGRFAPRTLSDISLASNTSGKNFSASGVSKHVRDARVKFLCSYGGKILPRPSDKKLRYVGGETRMITVPRHIQLSSLRLKLADVYGHAVTFKYQLPEEDLDALVSVSSDEDLENMMEECDRLDAMEGSSRLRVFVFSASDIDAIDFGDVIDPMISEHQYVEAVNTIQVDLTFRQNDNVISPDSSKDLSGLPSGYAASSAILQDRLPHPSEIHHAQVYAQEQLTPAGNHPLSMHPQWKQSVVHVTQPPFVIVNKANEVASVSHANSTYSHGTAVAVDDFLDLESGDSASSSASSQHDLYHRSRRNSNSQMQSHLEQAVFGVDGDHAGRAGLRVQGEVMYGRAHTAFAYPHLETSQHNASDKKDLVEENEPLSPGALLQRQLQAADDNGIDGNRTFKMQGSQSTSDGNFRNPEQTFSLLQDEPQNEHFPFQYQENVAIQEGLLSDVKLTLEPSNAAQKVHPLPEVPGLSLFTAVGGETSAAELKIIEKQAILQQTELQELFLPLKVLPHSELTIPPYNNVSSDANIVSGFVQQPSLGQPSIPGLTSSTISLVNECQSDELVQKVLSFTNASENLKPVNVMDFDIGGEDSWLAPNLVSCPPVKNVQVDLLGQIGDQNMTLNASAIAAKEPVVTGLSLLDEYTDIKTDLTSPALEDCTSIDIVSDILASATLISCCSSPTDNVVMTLLDSSEKLADNGAVMPMVDEIKAGPSLEKSYEDVRLKSSTSEDTVQELSYQEDLSSSADTVQQLYFTAIGANSMLYKNENLDVSMEKESTETYAEAKYSQMEVQREHKNALPENHHAQDAVRLESGSMLERDLTIENSALDVEEEDVFSSIVDRPMNAAAIAEAEAIAHGLQTIRNCDLEELKELGSGTFGTVYHGKWRGTDVAIKRIKPSCFMGRLSERERLIADFWQEAFILGQLHHPNVVAFYGIVPDGPDGTLATVTEYMVNGSLKQALQTKDRLLDRRKRLIIAMDAAFGMEYLHKKNVVHFDLKCENLLVNLRDIHRPICKVGDLGLSKVKQQTMISGGVRGTLPWMAPELLNGSSTLVSEKVDVFSFGIALWELLTGEEPYASMHYGAIIGGIVTNTLRPPIPKSCDAEWRSLMEACWACDPSDRPTFTEIANSLRAMEAALTAKGQGQTRNVE